MGRSYLSGMLVALVGATGLIATSPAPLDMPSPDAIAVMLALSWALPLLLCEAVRRMLSISGPGLRRQGITPSPTKDVP